LPKSSLPLFYQRRKDRIEKRAESQSWYMVAPRPAKKIVKFIDEYCQLYEGLFPEVRTFEYFKYLHLGLITDIKRKTFPELAKVVGLENGKGFDYFFVEALGVWKR
jgi:hypothetical protein